MANLAFMGRLGDEVQFRAFREAMALSDVGGAVLLASQFRVAALSRNDLGKFPRDLRGNYRALGDIAARVAQFFPSGLILEHGALRVDDEGRLEVELLDPDDFVGDDRRDGYMRSSDVWRGMLARARGIDESKLMDVKIADPQPDTRNRTPGLYIGMLATGHEADLGAIQAVVDAYMPREIAVGSMVLARLEQGELVAIEPRTV